MRSPSSRRLRRRFANTQYPLLFLRFEDGHEIALRRGESKSFDAYAGETIKVVVVWDSTSDERDVVAVMKGEEFEEGD